MGDNHRLLDMCFGRIPSDVTVGELASHRPYHKWNLFFITAIQARRENKRAIRQLNPSVSCALFFRVHAFPFLTLTLAVISVCVEGRPIRIQHYEALQLRSSGNCPWSRGR